MSGLELITIAIIVFAAIGIFIRYWPLIITAIAFWVAYDQYKVDGTGADYWLIFICWSIAFIIFSKYIGFGGAGYDDGGETLATRDRRETSVRIVDHHRREFNKRF